MKGIPLRVHNVLDYVGGVLLILSPYIFGFSGVPTARDTFLVLGIGLIVYSALTDYTYSLIKLIPLGVHMGLDTIAGIAVILAPWVLGYEASLTGFQTALHFILGVGVLALVALTQPKSSRTMVSRDRDTTDIRRAA